MKSAGRLIRSPTCSRARRTSNDDLAMIELEVAAVRDSVIACHGRRADQVGRRVEGGRDGDRLRPFDPHLSDEPLGQATAVQRT
jgi:hypothetical protein